MTGVLLAEGVGERFREIASDGPLLLAMPVALIAGLVSFLSPCVLPLVPGYLSYMTGLAGADLEEGLANKRHRVLIGGALFVLGFSLVFVSFGAFFGGLGGKLVGHQEGLNRVFGVLTILLGLVFLGAFRKVPAFNREFRFHRLPSAGLAGAPFLGVVFGLGWTPCIGPTLGAVLTLSANGASAGRGALLTFVYCLGLGVPFILAGLAFRRAVGAFDVVKRHYTVVTRVGGGMLVVVGVLLVTGGWQDLVGYLQQHFVSRFTPSV